MNNLTTERQNRARRANVESWRLGEFGRPLDPAPFRDWLRRRSSTVVAGMVGASVRQVRRYRNDGIPPREFVVDEWLTRVDDGTRLDDLYPELYELGEADGHCAVGHPQGDSSSLAPRRSPTARPNQQEAA